MTIFIKLIYNGLDYGIDLKWEHDIVMLEDYSPHGIIRFAGMKGDGSTKYEKIIFAAPKEHIAWVNFIPER